MTSLNKKLLIYGGSAFVVSIILYMLFKKKNNPLPKVEKKESIEPTGLLLEVFTKSGTRLRKEPNTNSTILKTYQLGEILHPISTSEQADGVWYLVTEGGYVRSDVVTEKK